MTIDREEDDLYDPFPEPVKIEVTDSLDLHAFSPKEVKKLVENYLELASQRNFAVVRIIHGKGIGVQKALVRSILERSDLVDSFSDAESWGATIVKFKSKANDHL